METHQLHIVYLQRCNVSRLYIIFNFQLSIFNSIETHQLHLAYLHRCNVSRLYINFQFSTFNFQFNCRFLQVLSRFRL